MTPSPALQLELDLEPFSGPFDLLLALVLRDAVDLGEVPVADVCLRYLAQIEEDGEIDPDLDPDEDFEDLDEEDEEFGDDELAEGAESGPITFHAVVEVRPTIRVPGYDGLQVSIPSPEASDEEITAQVDRMRAGSAALTEVDRVVNIWSLHAVRLPPAAYLQMVAATNFKQRVRKMMEYYHADRLAYAVAGTPNLLEYDQGFFVKNGDGSADLKPIAHLYKTQVYALARHMGLPEVICNATPTTDTYSLSQGQDEFYYALPYKEMDVALWHLNQGLPAAKLAECLGMSEDQARFIYQDIEAKRRTTAPLHWPALLVDAVSGPMPRPAD